MDQQTIWRMAIQTLQVFVSWPVLIFVLVMCFRRPLIALIGRVNEFEGWGTKMSFGTKVTGVKQLLDKSPLALELPATEGDEDLREEPEPTELPATEDKEDLREEPEPTKALPAESEELIGIEDVQQRSATSRDDLGKEKLDHHDDAEPSWTEPSAVIIESWEHLIRALKLAWIRSGRSTVSVFGGRFMVASRVLSQPGISEDAKRSLKALHELRNRVAHAGYHPTRSEAVTYKNAAHLLEVNLRRQIEDLI